MACYNSQIQKFLIIFLLHPIQTRYSTKVNNIQNHSWTLCQRTSASVVWWSRTSHPSQRSIIEWSLYTSQQTWKANIWHLLWGWDTVKAIFLWSRRTNKVRLFLDSNFVLIWMNFIFVVPPSCFTRSLSLEYHMESIFGTNISSISNNIPQVRYLQAPAAFKVLHLKKFLSSKYDLSNLKKPMCIDIIYEGDVLSDEFSLMDIAYTYNWERVSIIFKLFLCFFPFQFVRIMKMLLSQALD